MLGSLWMIGIWSCKLKGYRMLVLFFKAKHCFSDNNFNVFIAITPIYFAVNIFIIKCLDAKDGGKANFKSLY